MNSVTPDFLCTLATSALERTAMVLAEPASDDAPTPKFTHSSRIIYTGPTAGVVYLDATEPFLRELASSILGVEPSEIDLNTSGLDALKELTNIIGGSFTVAIAGEDCPFSLGLPELISNKDASARAGVSCVLASESGSLRVTWSSKGAASKAA